MFKLIVRLNFRNLPTMLSLTDKLMNQNVGATNISTKGEVSGTITLKIDAPTGMDLEKLQDYLNNPINMIKIAESINPILANIKQTEVTAFS